MFRINAPFGGGGGGVYSRGAFKKRGRLIEVIWYSNLDNRWKTQIQKFKTPKQAAIKFVKTLNQTFKLHYRVIYELEGASTSKYTNFFHFADDGKKTCLSFSTNSDKQKVFVACMSVVFKNFFPGKLQKEFN